jgi:hypothetical protein
MSVAQLDLIDPHETGLVVTATTTGYDPAVDHKKKP